MSTKKIQIIESLIKHAENANTLGGRSASYFAVASDVKELKAQIGDESVATQISTAVDELTADDFGVYVQDTEPKDAVEGDIWIDSGANSNSYLPINHVHNDATTTTSGFMSAADKAKLDDLHEKVGDKSVADQINGAIAGEHSHDLVTTSKAGFMSPEDKIKLDGITGNTGGNTGGGSVDGGDADTLDGKHASDFVLATEVVEQINTAMNALREEILGGEW